GRVPRVRRHTVQLRRRLGEGIRDHDSRRSHRASGCVSARSDPSFQETQGNSSGAGGMLNVQPNAETNPLVPPLGRLAMTCLNAHGNAAVMTGTVTDPTSTNDYTGAPWYRPAKWWIVGAYRVVIDNEPTAPSQMYWGFFVNPDKDHVISTGRCFG